MSAPSGRWLDVLSPSPRSPAPNVHEALLVDYPVALGLQRQEWRHGLLREFQLITYGEHEHRDEHHVPRQLLALADEMTTRYGELIERHTGELEHATAAGADCVVLRYPLEPAMVSLEIELANAMEEVDAYCREQALMTLAPTNDMYLLRRWIVEEVSRQYVGEAPRSWPIFRADVEREVASTE